MSERLIVMKADVNALDEEGRNAAKLAQLYEKACAQ